MVVLEQILQMPVSALQDLQLLGQDLQVFAPSLYVPPRQNLYVLHVLVVESRNISSLSQLQRPFLMAKLGPRHLVHTPKLLHAEQLAGQSKHSALTANWSSRQVLQLPVDSLIVPLQLHLPCFLVKFAAHLTHSPSPLHRSQLSTLQLLQPLS
jgi:hypothetical protein